MSRGEHEFWTPWCPLLHAPAPTEPTDTRHNIFVREEEEEEEGGGWYGTLNVVGHYDRLMVELRNEDPRAFTRFMRMPPAMYDKIVQDWHQPLSSRQPTGDTPWTRPEGGLSKLCIGKCEDLPCAVALCRASDDAERCLPVIRQC